LEEVPPLVIITWTEKTNIIRNVGVEKSELE
jgi:hypothetical protein